MLRRFKQDMAALPDQPDSDEYDEVPVEGFGAALLAGYGWKKGDAIGKNSTKKEAKVVQYDRRTGPQGLGFGPSMKRDRENRRDQMQDVPNARHSQQSRSVSGRTSYKVPCLHSHIRVRVVGKTMSKRLYMMKGRVLDVTGPTTCDIAMDGGSEVVQGVEQDMLETVLPRVNGHVLVLCGKHKGVYGRLIEKNPEEQIGVLEDADTRDMIPVGLDKIAEYVGDPELIGY
jgi:G patch domain/KOW motif-containing protein